MDTTTQILNFTQPLWVMNNPEQSNVFFRRMYILIGFAFLACLPACVNAQQKSLLKAPAHHMTKQETNLLIDSIDLALQRWYVFHDKVPAMLTNVKKNRKSGVYYKITNRNELSAQLLKDIQQANPDAHLDIKYYPELSEFLKSQLPDSIKQQQHKRALNKARENNFGFTKIEILQGNIGYIRLDAFYPFVEEAKPILDGALRFVSNCNALIIDMRYNGGGSPEMVLQTQQYFFGQKTPMNDIIDSKNDTLKRWADPATTSFKLNMPVYILTSHNTFSGAEDFTYGMQQVKRATVVGDTTGGGAHPSADFSLGQGFVIRIPTQRSYNMMTQTDWDNTGVYPDIAVPSNEALTKAQLLILLDRLAAATDEEEKKLHQWNLTSVENKALLAKQYQKGPVNITNDTLLKYVGEYTVADPDVQLMPFSIILKDDKLYRHFEDGYEDVLIPISTNKFVIDDNSGRTIEFERNTDEDRFGIILTRENGKYKLKKR